MQLTIDLTRKGAKTELAALIKWRDNQRDGTDNQFEMTYAVCILPGQD